MQTIIQVISTKGRSLRDYLANDSTLEKFGLEVVQERKPGRSPGWTKVKSIDSNRRGSVNIQWDGASHSLTCRVVNKGAGSPNLIIGDLLNYLLKRHRKRIKLVMVLPG